MASGRANYLTKQAGEYIVAAELSRRGFVATTFAGNVPSYDIVAVDDRGGHALVQVKAIAADSWQFTVTQFPDVVFEGSKQIVRGPLPAPYADLICVMVRIAPADSRSGIDSTSCRGKDLPVSLPTVTRRSWRNTVAYAPSSQNRYTPPSSQQPSQNGRTGGTC
jgi:hypothetical protein